MATENAATSANEVDRIVADLDVKSEKLPVEAIRQARAHRDLMVPKLIEVIRQATAAARAGSPPEGDAQFFALFLLTEFRAAEALPAILEAVSLPGELPFELFGDAITAVLSRVLVTLSGGQPQAIERLIRNRELNEYVRWEAAESFLYLVRDGRMGRAEAVQRLQQYLREAIDAADEAIAGPLVVTLDSFAPAEALSDIEEAFRQGLIDPLLIRLDDVKRDIAQGESQLREGLDRCPPTGIDDTIAELQQWASFMEPQEKPKEEVEEEEPLPLRRPLGAEAPSSLLDELYGAVETPRLLAGRNDPCPCGSGKKFKKCCGARR